MCGIVGILGREPVATGLIDSLKRLEYRGYDSAGVATLEGGHLASRRAEGKLKNLEQRLAKEPLKGCIGSDLGHYAVWRADSRKLRRIGALADWLAIEAQSGALDDALS